MLGKEGKGKEREGEGDECSVGRHGKNRFGIHHLGENLHGC